MKGRKKGGNEGKMKVEMRGREMRGRKEEQSSREDGRGIYWEKTKATGKMNFREDMEKVEDNGKYSIKSIVSGLNTVFAGV